MRATTGKVQQTSGAAGSSKAPTGTARRTRAALSNVSADHRLAQFSANTLGVKLGAPIGPGGELSVRLEAYRQTQKAPANAPGALQTLDTAPALTATMLLVGYALPF